MGKRHKSLKTFFGQVIGKKIPVIITMVMVLSLLPADLYAGFGLAAKVEAAISLSAPVSVSDSSMISGKKVTWDCVYFGTYPQTEVKTGDTVYSKLASGSWDSNGDYIYGGEKYHRVRSTDATYVGSTNEGFYNWDSAYHYFRYEPIKWRVLKVSSSEVLLVSDKLLDDQFYHTSDASGTTWETCSMRRWLNNTFFNRAFSDGEKTAIKSTTLVNATTYTESILGSATYGGNSTVDKVFLLARDDTSVTQTAVTYGFVNNSSVSDEGRVAKSTDYANAMGVQSYSGNSGYWWLRSTALSLSMTDLQPYCAVAVEPSGVVNHNGFKLTSYAAGVRPAIYLDRSQASYFSYAGTVSSDGTTGNGQSGEDPDVPIVTPSTYIVNYDANGGSGAPAAQTKTSGVALTLSTKEPIRSGYTFVGWATSKSAVSANYKAGGTYTNNGDVTLYAVWVSDGTGTGDNPGSETGDDGSNPVVITPRTQTITASSKTVAIKTPVFSLGARTNGDGKLTYRSSKTSVATVSSSGKITVRNYGITYITITAAATTAYKKAVKTVKVTVVPKKMKIKSVKSPKKGQLKVTWVKDKAAGGYQVQFCLDSKFKGDKFQKNFQT